MAHQSARTNKRRNARASCKPQCIADQLEARRLLSASFASPVNTQITDGIFPVVSVATGDVNGDGIPDLIANRDDNQAQIYLGTNTGALTPSNFVPTGGMPIALGDFTGNGDVDLASTDGISLGNGAGTFATATAASYTMPANTIALYAVDVNGDGNLDLVAVTLAPVDSVSNNATPILGITVSLGTGTGTFDAGISTMLGTSASLTNADGKVVFGDFNGNGLEDVVTPFGIATANKNGAYSNPVPLPFTTPATGGGPIAPIYVAADITGAGDYDIVTEAPTKPGYLEIFDGNGSGAFVDKGAVLFATGDTISALAAADVQSIGVPDLLIGYTDSLGNTGVADMANNGSGTFASPVDYSTPGAPVIITTGDFNSDGKLDILAIDQPSGGTSGSTTLDAVDAAVLLNTQTTLPAAMLTIVSAPNPVVDNAPLNIGAFVQTPADASSTAVAPTGTVTFYEGSTALADVALVNGKANYTFSASGVGVENFTFTYSGDTNWASETSSVLHETVLQTASKVPLLIPSVGTITLPNEFINGDTGNVSVVLTNGGGAGGSGVVDIDLYLSKSGLINSQAIQLNAPMFQNRHISVPSGRTLTLTTKITAGNYAAGNYFVVAQVVPVLNFTSTEISSASTASSLKYTDAGLVFGSIGTHKGKKLTVTDASGDVGVLSLAGPGEGTVTVDSANNLNITFTATTAASQFTITSKTAVNIGSINATGDFGSISGRLANLQGNVAITGGIKQIHVASVEPAVGLPTTLQFGGDLPLALSLGNVGDVTLAANGRVNSLTANTWTGGSFNAIVVASMNIAGVFSAGLTASQINAVKIGQLSSSLWTVENSIQSLRVLGSVSGSDIYVGENDNSAVIGSILIGGNVSSSEIASGFALVTTGETLPGLITVLPKGRIGPITVGGTVSSDSYFLAYRLPTDAKFGGAKIATATDPRFTPPT